MKKYIISALFILGTLFSFSQEENLLSLYTKDQLTELKSAQPEVIDYWMTYLERGWALDIAKVDQAISKTIAVPTHTIDNPSLLNPLDFKVYPKEGTQYIGIENSDLVLVVYPKSHIIYHYNKKRAK